MDGQATDLGAARGRRPTGGGGGEAPGKNRPRLWRWLLLIPFVALLWPPWYARAQPELWGFPFFYWYQFAWVVLTALITGLVYRLDHRLDHP